MEGQAWADSCSLVESEDRPATGTAPGLCFSAPSLGVGIPSCCFLRVISAPKAPGMKRDDCTSDRSAGVSLPLPAELSRDARPRPPL